MTFVVLSFLGAITYSNFALSQVDIYMSELIGERFMMVLDKNSGEFRTYRFIDEDGDGWASGVQEQYMPVTDPDGIKQTLPRFTIIFLHLK